jgi:hypothetical protein
MADKAWKAFERRIAKFFGCKRRGADYGGAEGGKDDLTHAHYAVECKLLSRPSFQAMLSAARQAEGSARGREPVAIIKRKNDLDADALVVMRLETFRQWRV